MTEQERELQQRLEMHITCGNESCNCNYMGYCMESIDTEPHCL